MAPVPGYGTAGPAREAPAQGQGWGGSARSAQRSIT